MDAPGSIYEVNFSFDWPRSAIASVTSDNQAIIQTSQTETTTRMYFVAPGEATVLLTGSDDSRIRMKHIVVAFPSDKTEYNVVGTPVVFPNCSTVEFTPNDAGQVTTLVAGNDVKATFTVPGTFIAKCTTLFGGTLPDITVNIVE